MRGPHTAVKAQSRAEFQREEGTGATYTKRDAVFRNATGDSAAPEEREKSARAAAISR
jgi:hypothetical protein